MGDMKISLKSARVNAGMTQKEAAQAFSKIYKIPLEGINFLS